MFKRFSSALICRLTCAVDIPSSFARTRKAFIFCYIDKLTNPFPAHDYYQYVKDICKYSILLSAQKQTIMVSINVKRMVFYYHRRLPIKGRQDKLAE